jgi:hypothetical protein
MPSVSTLRPTQSEFPADPPIADRARLPHRRLTQSETSKYLTSADRPSRLRRASRALARYLIAVGIGVAGTLAWQSYGEIATQTTANWAAQNGLLPPWLSYTGAAKTDPPPGPMIAAERPSSPAVQTAPSAPETAPAEQNAAPAAASADLQPLEAMRLSLATMQQRLEQLAAAQEEMASNIAKLQAGEQDIRRKISAGPPGSASVPASRPKPTTTPPSRTPMPAR